MNRYALILRLAIAPLLVFACFAFALLDTPNIRDDQDQAGPSIASVPNSMIMDQAAEGRTCDKTPILTDHILFTDKAGTTKEIDFDSALAASKAGKGTVRLYCK